MVKAPVNNKTGNSATTVSSSVKTGDHATFIPVFVAIAASATCLISVLALKRKKKR